ncbi:predicted protein [Thalassiosira pseudonana CCMP1335]|uniref:Uncharacterized protein n=1 Tax=Thalassiosira pseudonana TaxID=35128 RepID=B8C8G6_THAPS|nr:predicted protein [Thalassiosira pseudonana CCMP1335]EED90480.1 predicted protein [Thalassiosira pseudonana CCMP1335]|eukprot:g7536.t1 g7536   contig24:845915-846949(-)
MFKSLLPLVAIATSSLAFQPPPSTGVCKASHESPTAIRNNFLRDIASYPDESKMYDEMAGFDRNGAFSGQMNGYRGMNGGGMRDNMRGGGNGGYQNQGGYMNNGGYSNQNGFANQGGYGGSSRRMSGSSPYGDSGFSNSQSNNRREGPVSGSRGYSGAFTGGGGYGQDSSYRGYSGGGINYGREISSYNGYSSGTNAYNRSENRPGGRSGRSYMRGGGMYPDNMYSTPPNSYYNNLDRQSSVRQNGPVRGFNYSSRVREDRDGRRPFGSGGDDRRMYENERMMDRGMYGGGDERRMYENERMIGGGGMDRGIYDEYDEGPMGGGDGRDFYQSDRERMGMGGMGY